MVLIIISLLSLLCTLYSSLSTSNQLLQSNNKLSMRFTLNHCTNHNVNGVYQLLPRHKLSWRELCT